MDKPSSSQLLPVTARAKSQPVEEITHDDQKKILHPKEDVSRIIGWILRGGVILSATIILIGFLLLLIQIGEQPGYCDEYWCISALVEPGMVWFIGIAIPGNNCSRVIASYSHTCDNCYHGLGGFCD